MQCFTRKKKEDRQEDTCLCLNSVFPLGEVRLLLLLLLCDDLGLLVGESPAHGTSLLGSEVQWHISGLLLVCVGGSENHALVAPKGTDFLFL